MHLQNPYGKALFWRFMPLFFNCLREKSKDNVLQNFLFIVPLCLLNFISLSGHNYLGVWCCVLFSPLLLYLKWTVESLSLQLNSWRNTTDAWHNYYCTLSLYVCYRLFMVLITIKSSLCDVFCMGNFRKIFARIKVPL